MILRQLRIDANSPFLGKTLKDAGIREKYHCLIVGVERGGETCMLLTCTSLLSRRM